MKKIFVLLAVVCMSALMASATTVQYGTSGDFGGCTDVANQVSGCAAAGNTILFGTNLAGSVGLRITFTGIPNGTQVDASPSTSASLGFITLQCLDGTTTCASQAFPTGLILNIAVTQQLPTAGGPTNIPAGTITGAIAGQSSSGLITWPVPNTIAIGNITYRVTNNPLDLVPPSSNNGVTSVQGRITDASVPEPATYSLVAFVLLGIGLARRK